MPVILELDRVTTGYGRIEILHDVTMSVPAGSVVALLGPNGAGKTTTLKAISGTLPIWRGAVRLEGKRLERLDAYHVAKAGVTLIPEGRGVFPGLTVKENLEIAARSARGGSRKERSDELARVLDFFPRLRERMGQLAGTMSGGEQQMLALTRAFLSKPKVLLMDEISMGLAPLIVEHLFEAVSQLKEEGQTIVLVEQFLTYALRYADICYMLNKGRISFVGEPAELRNDESLVSSYLGG